MDLILNTIFPAGDEAFDIYHLRPLASLNRHKVIALPAADPAWVGRAGWELLSKHALVEMVRLHVKALDLEDADPSDFPRRLNACLESSDAAVRQTAEGITREFGRRLGCLVASLLLSHGGLTDPLTAWEAAYLDHWRGQVRHIILGGGHASGRLGELIALAAQEALAECGVAGFTFRAARFPAWLPLIGDGRSLPPHLHGAAVLVDCGGTLAKRGIAFYDAQERMVELRRLPEVDIARVAASGAPTELAQAMLAAIVETIHAVPVGMPLAPCVTISVAAYVKGGQPLKINRDAYTSLYLVAPDMRDWFARNIQEACGQAVQVEFVHDGDAAACALAGEGQAAVIMLGSALGIGFVPPADGYRRLSDGFGLKIRE